MSDYSEETKPKVIVKPGEEEVLAPAGKKPKIYLFGFPVQEQHSDEFTPCEKTPLDHL